MNNILEISNRKSKSGRRKIEIVLHKIPTNDEEVNRNGIHWSETNTRKNIESVKGIPICAEFTDETKEVPLGHGYTSTEVIDGKNTPLFENSEVVGTIESGEIRDVEVNGETIRALVGKGWLYDQRYPKFAQWVKTNVSLGTVDTSIEVMGNEENDNRILYEDGGTDEYRVPSDYSYSGVAILSILPADSDAIVLECAQAKDQSKEETFNMTEKEIMDAVTKAIAETNSVKADVDAKISELNSQISAKEAEIAEKDAKIAELNKAVSDAKADSEAKVAELNTANDELNKLKADARKVELNEAIKDFSDDEKKYAEVEINAFNENPMDGDVNAIVSKIYAGIGEASKKADAEARIAEQNSAKDNVDVEDIFSEMNNASDDSDEDVNIF